MTTSIIAVVTTLALSVFSNSYLSAQPISPSSTPPTEIPQVADPVAEETIRQSLKNLKSEYEGTATGRSSKLDEPLLRNLGFESIDQLDRLVVGERFALFEISPDALKKYAEKKENLLSLLVGTPASIYPLLDLQKDDQQVRSSITIISEGDRRIDAGIGDAPLIRLLTESRMEAQKMGQCLKASVSNCFVVSIPALGLHLFGVRDVGSDEILFVRINDVRGHVRPNDFRPASDVLVDLSRMVKPRDREHRHKAEKKFKGF